MAEYSLQFVLEVVNEASATLNQVQGEMNNVTKSADLTSGSMAGLGQTTVKTGQSFSQSLGAITGVAAGFAGLYASATSLEQAQKRLDLANLRVSNDLDLVSAAQVKLNDAIVAYGPSSAQATQAAKDLSDVQEKQRIDINNVDIAQAHVNETWISSATTAIPSALIALSSLPKAYAAIISIATAAGKTLGLTGGTAELTGSELLGMGQGGVSASEALALTGESATVAEAGAIGLGATMAAVSGLIVGVAAAALDFYTIGKQVNEVAQTGTGTWGDYANAIVNFQSPLEQVLQHFNLLPASIGTSTQAATTGVQALSAIVSSAGQAISSGLGNSWAQISSGAQSAFSSVASGLGSLPKDTQLTVTALTDAAISGFGGVLNSIDEIPGDVSVTVSAWVDSAIDAVKNFLNWLGQIPGDISTSIDTSGGQTGMPHGYQLGGRVPHDGFVYAHEDEEILTPQQQKQTLNRMSPMASDRPMQLETKIILQVGAQTLTSIVERQLITKSLLRSGY